MIRNTCVHLLMYAVNGGPIGNPADSEASIGNLAARTPEQCLQLDKPSLKGNEKSSEFDSGRFIDDGEVLKKLWEPGMGVKAIQYCETKNNTFASIKIFVGNDKKKIPLHKHGSEGEIKCWDWKFKTGDYIREFSYTWNMLTRDVIKIEINTQFNDLHQIGSGSGKEVTKQYNSFQPFVGLYSFEVDGNLKGIGAYTDDCIHTPKKLPDFFSSPTVDHIKGDTAVASKTWVNERHGTS